MTDPNSLINIGELSKPATVLIEKISDGIGGIFRPHQIKRLAQAEVDAEKIRVLAQIEMSELQQRALQRFLNEEAIKQDNMESITKKALPEVDENAKPGDIDTDWIANFFDQCRLISDDEMQTLWAKVLAGEANAPGKFSKRTVNLLASLDKSDAVLFSNLCRFVCVIDGNLLPLIYYAEEPIYKNEGITFEILMHLNDIGLISFLPVAGSYTQQEFPKTIMVVYFKTKSILTFANDAGNNLLTGKVVFSHSGEELASICDVEPVPDFWEYVVDQWTRQQHLVVSSSD